MNRLHTAFQDLETALEHARQGGDLPPALRHVRASVRLACQNLPPEIQLAIIAEATRFVHCLAPDRMRAVA